MKLGTLLVLFVAIVAGAVAVLSAKSIINRRTALPAGTMIVVATAPLAYGTELTKDNIAEIPWSTTVLPDGAFKSKDELFKDGKRVEVPEGSYVVDRYDTAKLNASNNWISDKRDVELKATGDYLAYFSTAEDTKNFDFEKCTALLHVTDKGVFTDVPMGEWYSQYVYDAVKLDYMNGYKGTELFGPSDGFTRAQAAIVLFNMAGGTQLYPEFSENSLISYETSFSDVDPNAWYAYAVKWCEETGIVKGYPNGEFGVDDPITREQFAVMLANYATKAGVDVAAAKADLSVYPDAGSIDSWAYEAMEWAVSEGVMGGNTTLNPTDGIQRSEVAKMAVTYQPERPETGVIPRP